MLRRSVLTALLLAAVVAPGAALAETWQRPRAVIELFTSQGCSSCPPADRLVGEFARDPSLIALTLPVQIWDHLGWRDTLATPENTRRQKGYARARGDRQVYTPQVVVNGHAHAVGHQRAIIEALCDRRADPAMLSIGIAVSRTGDRLTIATDGAGSPVTDARVMLAVIERERSIAVERGENRGATIHYVNVVRELREIGVWSGTDRREIAWPDGAETVAILVQSWRPGLGPGPIVGAALLR